MSNEFEPCDGCPGAADPTCCMNVCGCDDTCDEHCEARVWTPDGIVYYVDLEDLGCDAGTCCDCAGDCDDED